MKKSILVMLVGKRRETAAAVQRLLTDNGCMIKTRLGLHESGPEQCSDAGCIILELLGAPAELKALAAKLNAVRGVNAKLVTMRLAGA
ncbi:MAG: hypothetical protein NC924_01190 [Candidatus Omnitrophica bacterium]|nr:hypothetical protein [Candidatus Omnitrophota bacterium]